MGKSAYIPSIYKEVGLSCSYKPKKRKDNPLNLPSGKECKRLMRHKRK